MTARATKPNAAPFRRGARARAIFGELARCDAAERRAIAEGARHPWRDAP